MFVIKFDTLLQQLIDLGTQLLGWSLFKASSENIIYTNDKTIQIFFKHRLIPTYDCKCILQKWRLKQIILIRVTLFARDLHPLPLKTSCFIFLTAISIYHFNSSKDSKINLLLLLRVNLCIGSAYIV